MRPPDAYLNPPRVMPTSARVASAGAGALIVTVSPIVTLPSTMATTALPLPGAKVMVANATPFL